MLELRNIVVKPEKRCILSIDEIRFPAGSICGIVGPSGSGKSTFLKVINLLIKPSRGTMHFFGTDLDLPSLTYKRGLPMQRQMALVAQKPVMFQTTVFENAAMGLRFRRLRQAEIEGKVEKALALVGLDRYAGQQATTLSGGEAQRIALARALVLEPRLLLLDEPTANLDPSNVAIFENVIRTIHQETGTIFLIVTHHLMQAKRLADHCLFFYQGNLMESADTQTFFSRPKSKELQSFISGEMIY